VHPSRQRHRSDRSGRSQGGSRSLRRSFGNAGGEGRLAGAGRGQVLPLRRRTRRLRGADPVNMFSFLIAIAPLLALVTMLLARRYPGEAVIERLRTLIESVSTVLVRSTPDAGRVPDFEIIVRGGRLLACSLAGRGPPFPT